MPSQHVLAKGRVIVLDDVLDCTELDDVVRASQAARFVPVNTRDGIIWKRNDPLNPSVADQIVWTHATTGESVSASDASFTQAGWKVYPTGTAFDRLLEAAVGAARAHGLLAPHDPSGVDSYAGVSASLYRYSGGMRLPWHNDLGYLGAFAAYLSPEWSQDSGGYLAVEADADHASFGIAQVIEPRCNRLVVLAPGVRHAVLSIATDVKRPRLSLSGFLLRRSQHAMLLAANARTRLREQEVVS